MALIEQPPGPFTEYDWTQGWNYESSQARGLLAWWPTINQGGPVLVDSSGSGGVSVGAWTGTPDYRPNATTGMMARYDGSSRVEVPANSALFGGILLTLAGWFMVDGTAAANQTILKHDGRWIIRLDTNLLRLYFWDSGGGPTNIYTTISANTLYHFACTWDQNNLRLYVNGVEAANTSGLTSAPVATATTIGIGAQPGGGEALTGLIGDLRIYNYPKSPSEIQDLYVDPFDLYPRPARRLVAVPATTVTVTAYPTSNAVDVTGWTNPTQAYTDDGLYATAAPAKSSTVASRWGTFGLDALVPSGATVNSVAVEVQWKVSATNSVGYSLGFQPYISGVANGAEATTTTLGTSDTVQSANYNTLTRADLLDGVFVVRVRASRLTSNNAYTASLDYIKVTVVYTPGFTTNPQTITVSVSATLSMSRAIGKIVPTVSVARTTTLSKQIGKPLSTVSVSSTSTLTAFRQYLRTLAVNVAATLSLTRSIGKPIALSVTSVTTASRAITKTIALVSVTSVSTLTRQINKLISTVSVSATVTLAALATYARLLAVNVSQTPTMIRQVGKALVASVASTSTMTRLMAYARTLSVDVSSTSTLTRVVAYLRTLALDVASTSTLTTGRAYLRALSVEVSASVSRTLGVGKALTLNVASTPSLLRQIAKALAVDVASISSMTRLMAYLRTLAVDVSSASTVLRQIAKSLAVDVSSASTLTRLMAYVRTLAVDVSSTPTLSRLASFLRTLAVDVTSEPTLSKQIGKALTLTVASLSSLVASFISGGGDVFDQLLEVSVASSVSMARFIVYARTLAVEVASQVTMARLLSLSRTLSVEVIASKEIIKQVGKSFAVSVASSPTLAAVYQVLVLVRAASAGMGAAILRVAQTAAGRVGAWLKWS